MTTNDVGPVTLDPSFSLYVAASRADLIATSGTSADAVVVHGPGGPGAVRALRRDDFTGSVLFDRADYESRRNKRVISPEAWFDAQRGAGADRLLTSGVWVDWDPSGDALKAAVDLTHQETGESGATLLLALDSRWLTRGIGHTVDCLAGLPEPVALVLSHRDDPLGPSDAVSSLQVLARKVKDLTLLRSDHGSIGAVALGAVHGSCGLTPAYRHFVPPGNSGGGRHDDQTARVFVRELMDWFTGFTIAGWAATNIDLACRCSACNGQSLDRFFDPRLKADDHNRAVLTGLASYVLDAEPRDRLGLFSQLCNKALDHYGPMGKLSTVTEPKRQLLQWAQFPVFQLR